MQEDSLPLHILHMVSVVIHSLCKYRLTSPLIREKRQVGPGREKGADLVPKERKKKDHRPLIGLNFFIYHFDRKGTPFMCLLLTNSTNKHTVSLLTNTSLSF